VRDVGGRDTEVQERRHGTRTDLLPEPSGTF
jgi:hypothetical protein